MNPKIAPDCLRRFWWLTLLALSIAPASAQPFSGNNPPGAFQDFTVSIGAAASNACLTVPGNATAFSHLLLKRGGSPSYSDFDFIALQDGQTNAINLERPALQTGSYTLRVWTPTNSGAHSFTVTVLTNQADLRSAARPLTQSLAATNQGTLPVGAWHYFRTDLASNIFGWRVLLNSPTNAYPDLYLKLGALPTATDYLKRSVQQTNDTLLLWGSELPRGACFIGVLNPSNAVGVNAYTLRTEPVTLTTLRWDPGTSHLGTEVAAQPNTNGGDYYFKITTENSAVGAWRTVLNVVAGEANLYLSRGAPPLTNTFQYKSDRVGSDGIVIPDTAFDPGEDWYVLVHAEPGARWNLVTGETFVQDLQTLAADGSSGSGSVAIGGEGIRFFKTTIPANTLAWRLWLNGLTNQIMVKQAGVPLPGANDLAQAIQMLVVPTYLTPGKIYFVGVPGVPGSSVTLDSRQHVVQDLPFLGNTSLTVAGYGYTTYRIPVSATNLIAWQVSATISSGNAGLALRRSYVANEFYNDAYSEVAGPVTESLALVPDANAQAGVPSLSDGTYFVTVYGTNAHTFTLRSSLPEITPINFESTTTNTDTGRVGWRFFQLPLGEGLGELGWSLLLSNAPPGTRIALRRGNAPGLWRYRSPNANQAAHYDFISTTNFLQRPRQVSDFWYVGVYSPDVPLGAFTLFTHALTALPVGFDDAAVSRADVPPGYWEFFRIDVPANALGWDLRLTDVLSGSPRLVVSKEALPDSPTGTLAWGASIQDTNWPSGYQWAARLDWTERLGSWDGSQDESGRVLTMGMGRPLEPGTYYVGVISTNLSAGPLSFTLRSRGIGDGFAIPVGDLGFHSSNLSYSGLAPREVAVYRVSVPSNSPSWKVKLTTTGGDAVLAIARDHIPNITASRAGGVTNTTTAGKKMLKPGNEHFVLLPSRGKTNILAGTYYLVVAAEGVVSATNRTSIGTGTSSFMLESIGFLPQARLGFLDTEDLVQAGHLEGGEVAAYHFQNRPGTIGFEILLQDRTNGYPVAASVGGVLPDGSPFEVLGDPGNASRYVVRDLYGNEGGEDWGAASPYKITVADPYPIETVMVKARELTGEFPDADYTLRIRKLVPEPLAFDGGLASVTNQTESWAFFQVDVPEGALGWDIRLTNVTSGSPQLVVARDALPVGNQTLGWSPSTANTWPSGLAWAADRDWTGRMFSADGVTNETGRILAMGTGRPLVAPGTYYVGIYNPAYPTNGVTYSVWSRGIGQNLRIPVVTLPFAGGVSTNTGLVPREAAYYRVVIPTNATSWRVRLSNLSGESLLLALTNSLPSVLTGQPGSAGKLMQKVGNEYFVLLPATGETNLPPGTNYLAVVSEGDVTPGMTSRIGTGTSSFIIESLGELPVLDLGVAGPVDLTDTNSLYGGDVRAYRFSVPPALAGVEVRLTTTAGAPTMVLRGGTLFPSPGAASASSAVGSVSADAYGNDGGAVFTSKGDDANQVVIMVPSPTNDVYTLFVKARAVAGSYLDASYALRIRTLQYTPLDFDGGLISVSNHVVNNWRVFRVDVPAEAEGWDIRLADVTSGTPRLVVRRDSFPDSLQNHDFPSSPTTSSNWPSGAQWAASQDWTRRQSSANGVTNEDYRILAMGMGLPLEAGTYYVGVLNSVGSVTPMNYRVISRGIGAGLSLPLTYLPFAGGSLAISNLPPREAAYFRVDVPTNASSWKLKLTATAGESMMLLRQGFLPNTDTGQSGNVGSRVQKADNEHLLVLPVVSTDLSLTNLPAGRYYLAVVGEGANATNTTRIGVGVSHALITSFGSLPPDDLGTVGPTDLLRLQSLEGGESALYRFTVPVGILGVEVRLDNRTNSPFVAVRSDTWMPNPGTNLGSVVAEPYGIAGGGLPTDISASLLTFANPVAGDYSVAIKARGSGSPINYLSAGYTLRVRNLPVPSLNFSSEWNTNGLSDVASGSLLDNQRAFYRVDVPTNALGWVLDLSQSSGQAYLRVRRGALPSDRGGSGMPFTPYEAVIAPPFLTNGTWYVEVLGSNSATFTLTSRALVAERTWYMPALGEPVTTPGLTAPDFGDSGVGTNGVPLAGDQGTDLPRGYSHYYAVVVPSNNVGVLRTELQALSGNPDLYLRTNQAPTVSHSTTGVSGVIYDRVANGTVSEYANWVPLDGKADQQLRPGTYYLAVRATGTSNARYRLRLSTGAIQDLALDGGSLSGQTLASNDWRYYRVQVPNDAPANWTVSFNQQLGNVRMYVRDTVPPGNGASTLPTDIRDWATDNKNRGPYTNYVAGQTYTFNVPPVRPGSVYYLGFRALSDATFSLSSSSSGSNLVSLPLDFYTGFATSTIPAGGSLLYRIFAPADASRLRFTNVHAGSVLMFLENGTLPRMNSADPWRSSAANSRADYYLGGWPWIRNVNYFLVVTNTSALPQPFSITMTSRSVANDDNDNDHMLDWWEYFYFGNTTPTDIGDFDGDGVSNLAEYLEGTNPADRTSLRPRLTVFATNGVVNVNPVASNYTSGATVTLAATPNAGFVFLGWTGAVTGTNNPLTLVLTSNVTLTAQFRVPGDDFLQRTPILGSTATVNGSNVGATKEPGEPNHAGIPGGHSVWWTWTAPLSGPVLLNTAGTTFPNALAVYTGTGVSSLVPVASDLDGSGPTTSQVSFDAVAGTAYAIAVDGGGGATGTITLNLGTQNSLTLEGPSRVSGTQFGFTLVSSPGQSIRVEVSEDLANWALLTNVVNASGSAWLIDTNASVNQRFYRAVAP
jgi:hypothetical protein